VGGRVDGCRWRLDLFVRGDVEDAELTGAETAKLGARSGGRAAVLMVCCRMLAPSQHQIWTKDVRGLP
jgi:hypothetical protein